MNAKNRRIGNLICSDDFSGFRSRILSAFVLVVVSVPLALAGSKTGADFLKIPVGARAVSLGQAYTALAGEADSINWNVAGLARMQETENGGGGGGFTFSHLSVFEENNLDNLGVAFPVSRLGRQSRLGFSVTRFSIQDQQRRGADRQLEGTFGGSDISLGVALAGQVSSLSVGGQVKVIRQELAGETADGVALDLGLISAPVLPHFSVGASVRNWGSKMKFIDEDYRLPLTISVGTVYQPLHGLVLAFDVHSRPYQDQIFLAFGSEFTPLGALAIRAGYLAKIADAVSNSQKTETQRGDFAGLKGLSGGLRFSINRMNIDYAFTPFGELGNTQTVTLSSRFGGQKQPVMAVGGMGEYSIGDYSPTIQKREEFFERTILIIPFEKDLISNSIDNYAE